MDVFTAKIRKIGSSAGVLIPREQLREAGISVGDDVEIGLLVHRRDDDIDKLFGFARKAGPFERDKKTREF